MLLYEEMSIFLPFDSFTPCQICTKMASLVLCDITLTGFPENSPLRTKT